jgi:hypothetical protein
MLSFSIYLRISNSTQSKGPRTNFCAEFFAQTLKSKTYSKNRQEIAIPKSPKPLYDANVRVVPRVSRSRASDRSIEKPEELQEAVFTAGEARVIVLNDMNLSLELCF